MSSAAISTGGVRGLRTQWALHLGALAAVLSLMGALFWAEIAQAVDVWWQYPAYSHCFLIIPISAWLIWEKRDELRDQLPAVAPKFLLAVPALLLFWFLAKLATINEARQIAFIGLVQIAILTMLGPRVYRTVLFPVLFLFFLVPVGQYLIPPMQRFATWFTDIGLTILGIVHYTEGTVIEVTTGKFEIAEACAGLRFLVATVTLGVLFAYLAFRSWIKIATLLAACVIVPLIANGLRCTGIIALAYFTNDAVAVEADHVVYGWGFNAAILLVILCVGARFRDGPADKKSQQVVKNQIVPQGAVLSAALATALAISAGPAAAYWHDHRALADRPALAPQSLAVEGWKIVPAVDSWRPAYGGSDWEMHTSLSLADSLAPPVDVVITYYGRARMGHTLIASTNSLWDTTVWQLGQSRSTTARLGSRPLRLDETVISSGEQKRLVWSTYWMDERFTTSGLAIKLLQLKTAFFGDEAEALVAFSTPIDGADELARARLTRALASLGDLPERLAGNRKLVATSDSRD
jgi:exosortase A